jgi:hypothetical protein
MTFLLGVGLGSLLTIGAAFLFAGNSIDKDNNQS